MTSDPRFYRPEGSYSSSSSVTSDDVEGAKWTSGNENARSPFIRVSELMEHDDSVFADSQPRPWRSWLSRFQRQGKHFRLTDDEQDELSESLSTTFLARKLGWKRRLCFGVAVFFFSVLGLIHAFNYIIGISPFLWEDRHDNWIRNWGRGGFRDLVDNYPADFTKDVLPIPCHSHNDYWRRIPLYEAIHFGCTGVEADVWLFDQELYVGHDTASLHPNRTLRTMYVNPLVDILDKMNTKSGFGSEPASIRGVFDQDPSQTLVLLIDFKTAGPALWPYVSEQLKALRDKNYLTYYNGDKTINGPITIVATGNAPYDLLVSNTTYRDIFFDAPLDKMWEEPSKSSPALGSSHNSNRKRGQGTVGTTATSTFDMTNSFYASVSFRSSIGMLFRGRLTDQQIYQIRGQIAGAHARGLKVRYWGAPSWPVSLRNHIWETLVREGADYLNVDDLRSAAREDWGTRKNRKGNGKGKEGGWKA